MESTTSVSKGVFLFTNGFKKTAHSKNKRKEDYVPHEPWYITYKENWTIIETRLQELHEQTYSVLLSDIVHYVQTYNQEHEFDMLEGIIPCATMLTGVNQPDHVNQFSSLVNKLLEEVTTHIALLKSQDAPSIKHLVESAVWQLIHGHDFLDDSSDMSTDVIEERTKVKKSQCNLKTLFNWYQTKYPKAESSRKNKDGSLKKTLVIIMQDFEGFNCNVLQDFVVMLSSYTKTLPIVLIFGVATSVSALHKSFPYHVSSHLLIKVFHSPPSHVYLNQVLENIFLNFSTPFHVSGKAFQLLTDIFLFYDFSVKGFIKSIQYCMMDHFYGDNTKSLCCPPDKVAEAIVNLSARDLENIRRLLSFRPFVQKQDCYTQIALLEDDTFFKESLYKEIHKLHDYVHSFYMCVRMLSAFVTDLPKNILGKTVREIYAKCSLEDITITAAFRECMQLLNFQSRVKLIDSINNAIREINIILNTNSPIKPLISTPKKNYSSHDDTLGPEFARLVKINLMMFLRDITMADNEESAICDKDESDTLDIPVNRYRLKETLLRATRAEKIQSKFEMIRSRFVSFVKEVFTKGLQPPHTRPFHEILFFSDVGSIKKQIMGSPRGALHTALSNPHYYLQCKCCILPSVESISSTLPDLCIAYKLHRECGKHINLYDWLQAFTVVLHPDEDNIEEQDNSVQIRFTRAVSELQFLGFIKSSKRKTDHVMRLTW